MVRCAACGAPREDGAARCGFCHSDFTLHERDLNTVCPNCLARVGDRAKYCHHCAAPLVHEAVACQATELVCPACQGETHLHSRRLGKLDAAVLECDRCAGLWLGREVFADLARRAAQIGDTADPLLAQLERASRQPPRRRRRGSFYRPCPTCQSLMPRRQYSHGSGVIIDLCKEHGVWFDADELPRVLRWIRAGGSVEDENLDDKAAPQASARPIRAQDSGNETPPATQFFADRGDFEIGELLVDALAALFKR